MLTLNRVVETVEKVPIWDVIEDADALEELTGDHVVQRELKRLSRDREYLSRTCQELKRIFPDNDEKYNDQFWEQEEYLEEAARRLLPDVAFNQ